MNMYYLKTEPTSEGARVVWRQDKQIVDRDYPNTPAEYKQIVVADYPEPENNGKLAQAYYDAAANSVYYEYTDPPSLEPDRVDVLQQQVDDLTLALADLMGGAL